MAKTSKGKRFTVLLGSAALGIGGVALYLNSKQTKENQYDAVGTMLVNGFSGSATVPTTVPFPAPVFDVSISGVTPNANVSVDTTTTPNNPAQGTNGVVATIHTDALGRGDDDQVTLNLGVLPATLYFVVFDTTAGTYSNVVTVNFTQEG